MDTGPAIRGRELDIYMWSCDEAVAFGRRPIQLSVLRVGWNPGTTAVPSAGRPGDPAAASSRSCGVAGQCVIAYASALIPNA